MKTKILRNAAVIILSLVFTVSYSQSNFSKNFEKTYDLNKNSVFKITNKYGKVHIENNTSNKLEILVTINVETKSKEKAEDVFKKIAINFGQSGDVISAETEIKDNIKNKKFSINYNIKMPEYLKIELSNKYGEIFINKLKSQSIISCKYGSLKINELLTSEISKPATVNIKYSNGNISLCDYVNLNVKYSEVELGESKVIILNSGYSKLDMGKAYIIKGISKYDPRFDIDEITKFEIEGKYSDYDIGILHNTLKANIGYSNLEIDKLSKGFANVFVDSKYGNVEIDVDEDASYKFNGKVEYGNIDCNVKTLETKHGLTKVSSGFVGKDENSKSKITIVCRYGNIEVE